MSYGRIRTANYLEYFCTWRTILCLYVCSVRFRPRHSETVVARLAVFIDLADSRLAQHRRHLRFRSAAAAAAATNGGFEPGGSLVSAAGSGLVPAENAPSGELRPCSREQSRAGRSAETSADGRDDVHAGRSQLRHRVNDSITRARHLRIKYALNCCIFNERPTIVPQSFVHTQLTITRIASSICYNELIMIRKRR